MEKLHGKYRCYESRRYYVNVADRSIRYNNAGNLTSSLALLVPNHQPCASILDYLSAKFIISIWLW